MTVLVDQPLRASENDGDGAVFARRPEDEFRRAAFVFASSTKRLVESSTSLGPNTKVAHAALVDIQRARDLLGNLSVPVAKIPAAIADELNGLTAAGVQETVADLAKRIETYLDEAPGGEAKQSHRGADLGVPVHPKNGKMLWAGVDCPACPSRATQRCRKDDGAFIEKPHQPRKEMAEAMASVSSTARAEEYNQA